MTGTSPSLWTPRLELVAWTVPFVDALIAQDRAALRRLVDATFPEPFAPPPETGDVLIFFREMLASDPVWQDFPPRLLVRRADRAAIGAAGIAGPPDDAGMVLLGYGIYPEFERQGFATEAAVCLIDWALERDGVDRVRATIKPDNPASRRVAAKAGMRQCGLIEHTDDGPLELWEIDRLREAR